MPRFLVRTLMIATALVAVLLTLIGPIGRWSRRVAYHRSQAAVFARLEAKEILNHTAESAAAANREGIRAGLIAGQGFASHAEEEAAVDRLVESHKQRAAQSQAAARRWAENRRDSETAAWWAFDPFAPGVP